MVKNILLAKNDDDLTPEWKMLYAHRLKAGIRSWARLALAAGMHPAELSRLQHGKRGEAKQGNRWMIYVALAEGQKTFGHHPELTVPQLARKIMEEAQNATVTDDELAAIVERVKYNLWQRDEINKRDREDRDDQRLWRDAGK